MAWFYKGRKYWFHNGKRYSCIAKNNGYYVFPKKKQSKKRYYNGKTSSFDTSDIDFNEKFTFEEESYFDDYYGL